MKPATATESPNTWNKYYDVEGNLLMDENNSNEASHLPKSRSDADMEGAVDEK